jgi:hypothetical protein
VAAAGQEPPADPDLELEERRVRQILEKSDLTQVVLPAQHLASKLRLQGHIDRAERLLDDVLEPLDYALADPAVLGPEGASTLRFALPYLLLERTELLRLKGRPEDALEFLDLADQATQAQESTADLRSHVVGLRAQIRLDQGLYDLAARWIEEEFDLLQQSDAEARTLLPAQLRRANLRAALGTFDLQIAELEPVLATLDALANPSEEVRSARAQLALRRAIALQEIAGDAASLETAREELEAIWTMPSAYPSTRRDAAVRLALHELRGNRPESAAPWLAQAREMLEQGLLQGLQAGAEDRAWLASLELRLARARGAAPETLVPLIARLEDDVAALVQAWSSQPTRAAGSGYLRYDSTRAILAELMSAQVALHGQEQGGAVALATLARAEAAGSLHRSLGARLPALAEIQAALLPVGTGALVFFPTVDRSLVFTVDSEQGARLFENASERGLLPICRRWWSEISESPSGLSKEDRVERSASLDARGKQISAMLLPAPVLERLDRWSTVHVVGADFLDDLPFEALPIEGLGPLGRAKAVGYLPSLAIGVHLSERAARRELQSTVELCVVSSVRSKPASGAPQDLPFGPDELESLAARVRGPLKALMGPQATLDGLRAADLARVRVLLFLTHGVTDGLRERPQGLRLSAGQALWCEDAEGLPGPPLVILAVCDAGRGPQREGDGPVGSLGGAFLRGGADCVVLSGAELAYAATLQLSTELLRELDGGCSVAEGLRRARVQTATAEATQDPYYWALIRAVGLAHRPVR